MTFIDFRDGFTCGIFPVQRSVLFTSAGRHTFRSPAELREHMARIGAQQELQLAEDLAIPFFFVGCDVYKYIIYIYLRIHVWYIYI